MSSTIGLLIFIGTYTPAGGESRGIYAVRLDPATGLLSEATVAAATPNPTFLAWAPDDRVLYALGEGPASDGRITGGAAAFAFNADTGNLCLLNSRGSGGSGSTHLAADSTGRMLIVASYGGSYVAAFPIARDGQLGERTAFLTPSGQTGPVANRQDKPHPHSITLSPDNRFAYVCDLGLDTLFCYRIDPDSASLTPAGEFPATAGAGPRHSKFSADGRWLYVINELASTITCYACDPATGALTRGPTVTTLPADFHGTNICAEIRIHPSGRFVYGSNRGHDSLAVFSRDPANGSLTPLQTVPSGGGHPRNFALSPDGHWLVCANRDSNNLVVFKVDPASGRLTPTGHTTTVPQAVCVLFAP